MTNAAQGVFEHLLSELKGWATARQSKRPTLLPNTNQHWGRCGPDAASVARVTQAVETHVTSRLVLHPGNCVPDIGQKSSLFRSLAGMRFALGSPHGFFEPASELSERREGLFRPQPLAVQQFSSSPVLAPGELIFEQGQSKLVAFQDVCLCFWRA